MKTKYLLRLIIGPIVCVVCIVVGYASGRAVEAQDKESLSTTRLFTGDDNKSHVEDVSMDFGRSGSVEVTEILFNRLAPGVVQSLHNAPRRQYVVTLSGEAEVELEDGSTISLRPGGVLLAEDTKGRGHITRTIGDEPWVSMFIPLAAQ